MKKQKGKPTVRRKRMFCSYGLARIAGAATGLAVGFFITSLIKIMLPQKKEIAKLFICTLKFPEEIKYDCGAPATACHGIRYPLSRDRFLLVRAPDGR
ncbi:hypothetical protein ACQ4WQ_16460 [Janthinobacterium sp. GB1R12]|uniref:hypothetical protein n=1 Tax=Janthinobacterium sp. GB1R12 TaxID=3424190 RepID=UPI003F233791